MDLQINQHLAFASLAQTLNGTAPSALRLIPAGRFSGIDGRPVGLKGWFLSSEDAHAIVAELKQRHVKFVIDWEHQTLLKEKNGQPAPAAARFSGADLQVRNGEIWATNVQWTKRGRADIESGEHLYISPVFPYDKNTGRVLGIHSAGLTNTPNIPDAPELIDVMAAANQSLAIDTGQTPMEDTLNIRELLGLGEDASDEDVVNAIKALQQKVADQQSATASANQKAEDAEAALAALNSQSANADQVDPAKFVTVEAFNEVRDQLAALSQETTTDKVKSLVTAALEDGRLVKAQEEWATDLGKKDFAALSQFLDGAKPLAGLRTTQTGGQDPVPGNEHGLTQNQIAICNQLNISQKDYAAELSAGQR